MPFNKGGPVTGHKADVGPGWHGLLDRMHAELAAADPDYWTIQVKEKFGCLRVYLRSDGDLEIDRITARYEALSAGVCEECGQPGKCSAGTTWWIKTLCDPCRARRETRMPGK